MIHIAGIVKSSFIDFPGKASTVVFLGGCNFRCGYCHNPEIVLAGEKSPSMTIDAFYDFLTRRRRFLDGVCVSGGEPTIHSELPHFLHGIKERGYTIKLDTNGTGTVCLSSLIHADLLDRVAMDIKAPLDSYDKVARRPVDISAIQSSAEILSTAHREGKISVEYRTTVCRELHDMEGLKRMKAEFPSGVPWFFQNVRDSGNFLDKEGAYHPFTEEEMKKMGDELCVNVR